DREVAMLTNPMETQLVSGLGIKVGGRTVPAQPMELTRGSVDGGRPDAFEDDAAGQPSRTAYGAGDAALGSASQPMRRVLWSADATERLGRVPSFVRGMVKRIYADYARERGIAEITPAMMDRARTELGLEDM
ncbi:MAG TPA: PCP reductase family protein, partial [Gemmatimonadota bacterium]|nr:PCP reductase family protein [Gemmatimonadota bacterium]